MTCPIPEPANCLQPLHHDLHHTTDRSASSWRVALAVEGYEQGPHRGVGEVDGVPAEDVEGDRVGAGGHLFHSRGRTVLLAVSGVGPKLVVDHRRPAGAKHIPAVDGQPAGVDVDGVTGRFDAAGEDQAARLGDGLACLGTWTSM